MILQRVALVFISPNVTQNNQHKAREQSRSFLWYNYGMKKNIGTFDRIVRLIIGVILLVVAFVVVTALWLKIILIILAIFTFYEALASWCLLYQLIGKNTCPIE